jgi:biopolymer transport protein ExbB
MIVQAIIGTSSGVENNMNLIAQGGPVVLVLIGLSVIGLTIVLYKLLQYRSYFGNWAKDIDLAIDDWANGEVQSALTALKKNQSAYAAIFYNGVLWLSENKDSEPKIREELSRQGQKLISRINSLNTFIELIAYLSPMLGLLGTVLGMIDVFRGLSNGTGGADAGMLAGGIWIALLTTAVGLTVAIPFAMIHAVLESKAAGIRLSLEDQLTRLFTARLTVNVH